jgi:ADP-ribose pyrophosphatase YjhB (NUDIX family)
MRWIEWSQRLAAIAQSGLTFATDPFDIERYEALRLLAAEVVADHTGRDLLDVAAFFARESGYATPKIDVRGAVFDGGKVLMVRERSDGRWSLPGGWADVLDTPRSAVEREIREESGYEARAAKLLAVLDRNHDAPAPALLHAWKIFVRCEIVGGCAGASIETDGVGFFSRDELPPLSGTRTTTRQLALMFAHLDDPLRPLDFD